MNKVVLIGRLTRDPELRYTPGKETPVTTITIAVDKFINGEKSADFISVVIYGKRAESTANNVNKEGKKRYVTEVIADEVQFLEWDKSNVGNNVSENDHSGMTETDGDIPF